MKLKENGKIDMKANIFAEAKCLGSKSANQVIRQCRRDAALVQFEAMDNLIRGLRAQIEIENDYDFDLEVEIMDSARKINPRFREIVAELLKLLDSKNINILSEQILKPEEYQLFQKK
jgi:hypothetical protein